MTRLGTLTALLASIAIAVGLAACGGGDDSTTATTGASGASGAQGPTGTSMTAGEYIDAPLPDQFKAVEAAAAANPDCAGADTKPGSDFQVGVAIDAASAPPDTPITQIVADNC